MVQCCIFDDQYGSDAQLCHRHHELHLRRFRKGTSGSVHEHINRRVPLHGVGRQVRIPCFDEFHAVIVLHHCFTDLFGS